MVKKLWTASSWECFKNNCICSENCPNYKVCQQIASQRSDKQPPMKKAVLDLIDSGVAIPLAVTSSRSDFLSPELVKTLYYWVVEGLSSEEIAKIAHVTPSAIRDRKSYLMQSFNYSYKHDAMRNLSWEFEAWAKTDVIPELEELKKVGVEC